MDKEDNKILRFPDGFIWGASTSAYQIEGGINNDWSEFEKSDDRIKKLKERGLNSNDFICGKACNSYNHFSEDLKCINDLNLGAYRMGIEWARVEPKKGHWNMREIEHYREILTKLKNNNIKTVLTLWHWTNPIWLAEEDGWANIKTINYFSRYTEFIVNELGDLVDYWVTLNEPMVHVVNGYISGKFPPNKRNPIKARKVFNILVNAHKKSYDIIHYKYPKANVSITKLTNFFEPARRWCFIEFGIAKLLHYVWNYKFLNKIKNHIDYIGFDYYFHDRIVCYPPFKKNFNKRITDMGWEIYPEGIYYVLKYLSKFNKPIFIMENGIADKKDNIRKNFIINHLRYIHKAIEEGVNVKGYFYWSLLDNFEWSHGFAPKFGLYSVDRKTFKRFAKPSSKVYAEICKNNKVVI